jgi:gliding motility-associated peptidyl-prolyl isomerase
MSLKKLIFALYLCVFIASCSQQQARKPITQSSGSFMKASIERNKKLNNSEETIIDSIMKSNPKNNYIASKKGYWFFYVTKNATDTITPKRGDVAFFDYEVSDIYGNTIYSDVELKPQTYYVDKENIMKGLQDGIKLMKKNEKVTFLFPSVMGYGYFGDKNKIGANIPLMVTVNLNNFKPENQITE